MFINLWKKIIIFTLLSMRGERFKISIELFFRMIKIENNPKSNGLMLKNLALGIARKKSTNVPLRQSFSSIHILTVF